MLEAEVLSRGGRAVDYGGLWTMGSNGGSVLINGPRLEIVK